MNLLYVPLIGLPACFLCMTAGVLCCCTLIGIPLGLTFFALGVKVLALNR